MARRSSRKFGVGDYTTTYWPYARRTGTGPGYEYNYVPPRAKYRKERVVRIAKEVPHPDSYYALRGFTQFEYEYLDDPSALMAVDMTIKNSSPQARHEQAAELEAAGFGGPLSGGEARALKNLFNELGKPDLVKHGWAAIQVKVMAPPTRYAQRQARWAGTVAPKRVVHTTQLKRCYVFKSPLPEVSFDKFVRLARLYKDDSGKLKAAVRALLANPDAHKEIEALDTIDLLANLGGSDD